MADPSTLSDPAHTSAKLGQRSETVLIVSPDAASRVRLAGLVEASALTVRTAADLREARWELSPAPPHLVVLDVPDPADHAWALEVLGLIRANTESLPVLVLLPEQSAATVAALERGADEVVVGRCSDEELGARFKVRIARRSSANSSHTEDPVTGALTPRSFQIEVERELRRFARGGRGGALVLVTFDELPELESRLGPAVREEVLAQIVRMIREDGRELDFVGHRLGVIALLLPATPPQGAAIRLERLTRLLATRSVLAGGQALRLTPIIGYATSDPGLGSDALEERAWIALMHQAEQLDLHPTRWQPQLSEGHAGGSRLLRALGRARTPAQVIAQQLACVIVPFAAYFALMRAGIDVTGVAYLAVVCALTATAAGIWAECFAALHPTIPPEAAAPPVPATAVIAAYLPNEAETIVESVEAMLAQDHPDLQVILAYNTPRPLPVEDELREIARRDPRFEPLRIEGSVSKAQNVNAALAHVRGEIVGLFDADHHPDPGAFRRAWQWLSNGFDVVQGHCVVRNGSHNLVTRLVATEFEAIYAVAHPGRARLHSFGIFGGSNGYWRTDLLRRTRMRGFMLTEDIDSSMRVVEGGGRIVSDPGLVSTELAPESFRALWNQRMRWAQGWSQVSLRHVRPMWRRPGAGWQGRFGAVHLLAWRELYPWISLQMFPILAVWVVRNEPTLDWFVPVFLATTIFTITVGPAQTFFAWKLAHPTIKQHRRWFWLFLVASTLAYTEWKNVIVRTGHLKELMGERAWKVTPRTARRPAPHGPDGVERRSPDSPGAPLRETHPAETPKPAARDKAA